MLFFKYFFQIDMEGKMKKLLFLIGILSSGLYGASIDHIQTYSPDYLANQAQTGMIDEVSPYYNPAGLSRLDKGKYVHLGLQLANGHEKMSYKGKEHKAHFKAINSKCFIDFSWW